MPALTRRAFLAAGASSVAAYALPAPPPRTVDSHVHVWANTSADFARFPFAPGANVPANLDASMETLLARMAAQHVERTVLIQVIHYKWDNRYLVDCLRRFPGKFSGVCRVNPEDPAAPDHLSDWTAQGCRGLRLSPAADAAGDWFRSPLMPPLWKRCEDLRVPMTLLLPASRLPDAAALIEQHPTLTVVIDHMADCPLGDEAALAKLLALAHYPRVFVKVTHLWSLSRQPYPFRDTDAMVARVRDAFGSQRLMGGTDWPIKPELATYEQRLALYRNGLAFLNANEREDVLFRTAQRVWP